MHQTIHCIFATLPTVPRQIGYNFFVCIFDPYVSVVFTTCRLRVRSLNSPTWIGNVEKQIYGFAIICLEFTSFDRVIEFEISFKSLNAFCIFCTVVQMRQREWERWKKEKIGSWLQQFCVINKQMKI